MISSLMPVCRISSVMGQSSKEWNRCILTKMTKGADGTNWKRKYLILSNSKHKSSHRRFHKPLDATLTAECSECPAHSALGPACLVSSTRASRRWGSREDRAKSRTMASETSRSRMNDEALSWNRGRKSYLNFKARGQSWTSCSTMRSKSQSGQRVEALKSQLKLRN